MSGKSVIEQSLERFGENQIFFAGQLYREELSDRMTEAAFYKALERLRKEGKLSKVAQGTYCKSKTGRFGVLPPSEKEIVEAFTRAHTGMAIGYTLYNSLRLTTQIGKNIEVLTSGIEQRQKTIGNVHLTQCPVEFDADTEALMQMLEVLQNYREIQDLSITQFLEYAGTFSKSYREEAFQKVYPARRYSKRTISFLADVLDWYGVSHSLNRYLSGLSKYDHPQMEALYEFTRAKK